MHILFLFVDGIGLGPADAKSNPFFSAEMPNLTRLLGGRRLVSGTTPLERERATLLALDACLGVPGMPQSATGQAALLTGINVPALIGMHYGPWPNRAIVNLLENGNLFRAVRRSGKRAAFLNAYPPSYFAAIQSGRRIYSVVPQAAVSAGLTLNTLADLREGRALSADLTGRGLRDRLGLADTPIISASAAGAWMATLAAASDFSFFEYWLSDYAGHAQDMADACQLLGTLDEMLGGLLDRWDDEDGLILLTSDHGNLEDLSTGGHTLNPVPALLVGAVETRKQMSARLKSLADVAPCIMRSLA